MDEKKREKLRRKIAFGSQEEAMKAFEELMKEHMKEYNERMVS